MSIRFEQCCYGVWLKHQCLIVERLLLLPRQAAGLGAPQTINRCPLPSSGAKNWSRRVFLWALGSVYAPLANISLPDFTFVTLTQASYNALSKTSWSKLLAVLRGSSGFFVFWNSFFKPLFFSFTMVIKWFRELRGESAFGDRSASSMHTKQGQGQEVKSVPPLCGSIEYVLMWLGVNSDLWNGSFWVEIRGAKGPGTLRQVWIDTAAFFQISMTTSKKWWIRGVKRNRVNAEEVPALTPLRLLFCVLCRLITSITVCWLIVRRETFDVESFSS